MSTSCKETDCDLLNLIEPLLDDESTQDSGSETGFSAQGYQTKYKTEVNVRVNSEMSVLGDRPDLSVRRKL